MDALKTLTLSCWKIRGLRSSITPRMCEKNRRCCWFLNSFDVRWTRPLSSAATIGRCLQNKIQSSTLHRLRNKWKQNKLSVIYLVSVENMTWGELGAEGEGEIENSHTPPPPPPLRKTHKGFCTLYISLSFPKSAKGRNYIEIEYLRPKYIETKQKTKTKKQTEVTFTVFR